MVPIIHGMSLLVIQSVFINVPWPILKGCYILENLVVVEFLCNLDGLLFRVIMIFYRDIN